MPSLNLTPVRMVKLSVLLPLLQAQLVASHGVVLPFSRVSTNASGSYTWPMVTPSPRLLGLNGLKLQFHSVPCSLEMVSVPLGPLPVLAPVLPDDPAGAEELQAVASAAASSAAAPVMRKRLIGVPLHWVSRGLGPWCRRDVWGFIQ